MRFQGERAQSYFDAAVAARPSDRIGQLQASEAMRMIYQALLCKMRADGYRVLDRRYRVSNVHKALILGSCWLRSHASGRRGA
jgi:phytoene/squalene synthetase